ncbi:MAG: hypothetical protein EP298_11735 [Gammaproteobacteria bacterium]|nr:MAG: hypothetical protein EP298_11735 [Gammaproteobacteria bacterium]UTW42072.1 hypothetical protein KFE69_11285 [bacterium SCSIO 12844]
MPDQPDDHKELYARLRQLNSLEIIQADLIKKYPGIPGNILTSHAEKLYNFKQKHITYQADNDIESKFKMLPELTKLSEDIQRKTKTFDRLQNAYQEAKIYCKERMMSEEDSHTAAKEAITELIQSHKGDPKKKLPISEFINQLHEANIDKLNAGDHQIVTKLKSKAWECAKNTGLSHESLMDLSKKVKDHHFGHSEHEHSSHQSTKPQKESQQSLSSARIKHDQHTRRTGNNRVLEFIEEVTAEVNKTVSMYNTLLSTRPQKSPGVFKSILDSVKNFFGIGSKKLIASQPSALFFQSGQSETQKQRSLER